MSDAPIDNTGHGRWYVVQTQPHAEAKAESHLARQGFEPYVPRLLKQRRHARKVETIAAPLFPRYLFVAVDITMQRWRAIQSTIGVSQLICNGDKPTAVPTGVVEELRSREVDGCIKFSSGPRFKRGQAVRILDGAFTDCIGLFEEMADRERVAVLLDLLGRKTRVVLGDLQIGAA